MLVLPTQIIPSQLTQFVTTDTPSRKLLNGFRNNLTGDVRLILVRNDNYCGQAFSYKLKEDQTLLEKLKSFQTDEEKIQVVQDYYVLVGKPEAILFDPSKHKISEQEVNRVLGQLGSSISHDAAVNLFLNCFDNFEDVESLGLGPILLAKSEASFEMEQTSSTNPYVGKSLLNVPTFDKKSGDWGSEHNYQLRVEIVTKVASKQAKNKQTSNQAQIVQDKQ